MSWGGVGLIVCLVGLFGELKCVGPVRIRPSRNRPFGVRGGYFDNGCLQ